MITRSYRIVVIAVVALMLLSACSAPAQPQTVTEKVVEKTVIVDKAVPQTVVVTQEKVVQATPVANAWGTQLPADAAPLDQQVLRLPCQEGKHMDVSANFYDSGKSCGAAWMWERLVMLDENAKVVPGVAEKWEQSQDGKTWTFHLRADAAWSDGSPLTAGDFEYALKRALNPKTGNSWAWFYGDIKGASDYNAGKADASAVGIKAVDDHTVTVETTVVTPYLPLLMAFPSSAPVPQKIVEQYGQAWSTDPKTALTNGPWKMTEWTHGKRIVLEPNSNYHGIYKPFIQKIIFNVGDGTGEFLSYQAGEIDGITADQDYTSLAINDFKLIDKNPKLKRELYSYPYMATRYLFFDTSKAPFNDLKVRQALSHAIDRDRIIQVVFAGQAVPAFGMLPPGMPAYPGNALDDIQKYDPEQAKKLLADAGFPGGKGFPELELWYQTPDNDVKMSVEIVQAMLKDNLGITVNARPTERKVFRDVLGKKQISFGFIGWEYDYVDPSNFLNVWDSVKGRHVWKNEQFDKLIGDAQGLADAQKRLDMYTQADKILSEDVGGVFLYHWNHAQMWKPYVKGLATDALGYMRAPYYYLGMQKLYIAKH